ncbi:MAG: 3-dehydroquinate synthase [Acidobacteria bacterium OLB17]|nr:MAG: 3-dehydroquinate synthase [Acidobacteria bacterium OLB17]
MRDANRAMDLLATISIGQGGLDEVGAFARERLGGTAKRAFIISNKKVFGLYGKRAEASLRRAKFATSFALCGDGERYKTLRSAEKMLAAMAAAGIERTDAVISLGGGIVGDLGGFAASIYLRGIRHIQVPTTLLAMVDSSVGGKTGVNAAFGKNTIGVFHPAAGVLADVDCLRTLPEREFVAGGCEMVKHAAIGGKKLLGRTLDYFSDRDSPGSALKLADLVRDNIAFKAKVVDQDPFEDAARTDGRSRKILNFGHTLAHSLEKVTNYRYFRHGEAVGYGILYAAELSKKTCDMRQKGCRIVVRCCAQRRRSAACCGHRASDGLRGIPIRQKEYFRITSDGPASGNRPPGHFVRQSDPSQNCFLHPRSIP